MAIPLSSIDVPYRDKIIDAVGFIPRIWQEYFREITRRILPLGLENEFRIVNDISAKSFATSDINTSAETITETNHNYYTGLVGQFTTTDTLPGGISATTDYYIIDIDANTYQIATSKANAIAGTARNITSQGVGTHTFSPKGDITNLKFTASGISHVVVDYLIQRVTTSTGATELIEGGILIFVFNPTTDDWSIVSVSENNPDDAGITFYITSAGQAQYDSTNITGTASISKISWRARTLTGKHSTFSGVGSR